MWKKRPEQDSYCNLKIGNYYRFDAAPKIMAQDGLIKGFYSGFGPLLFKQIPYTMAKFAVQGMAAEAITGAAGKINTISYHGVR